MGHKKHRKVEKAIINYAKDRLKQTYHLEPNDRFLTNFAREIIFVYQANYERADKEEPFLHRALEAYWRTTKLPFNEIRKHSSYFFMRFLQKNYWIIVIPRKFWKFREMLPNSRPAGQEEV